MPKVFKSIIFLLSLLFLLTFLVLVKPKNCLAQTEQEFKESLLDDQYTLEDNNFANNQGTVFSLITQIYDVSETTTPSEESPEVKGAKIHSLLPGGGAIPQLNKVLAYMIANPPVSSTEYLADLGSNLGLPIKSAYAQGTGWEALRPVLPLWKAFRNIAYLGFVVIFIAIGFMIMFRAKINPQTVITIEAALPKLVVTLLLITFSYAIAGLLIDLIYILIYVVVGILAFSGVLTSSTEPINLILSKNPFTLVFMKDGADIFVQAPGEAVEDLIGGIFGLLQGNIITDALGGLAKLIIGVAILFSLFKLFFSLLLSYLGIIISVIFSPFSLLFNALPGSTSFTNWLKGLFSNIIVFPAVAGMFLLGAILIGPRGNATCGDTNNKWCVDSGIGFYPQSQNPEGVWVPPMLNVGSAGGGSVNAFQGLIALGIIMMTPEVVSRIKKMLKVEPSGFGAAIAGGLLSPLSGIGGLAQQGYSLGSQISSMKVAREQSNWMRELAQTQGQKARIPTAEQPGGQGG